MTAFPDDLLNVADVLTSEIVDGEVRLSLGDSTDGVGIGSDCGYWGIEGFIGRPNDENDDGAAQVLYLQDGSEKTAVASRDNRFVSAVGELQPGDRAIVTDGAPRFFIKKATSTVALYTESETAASDKSMILSLDGANDRITIANGKCMIEITRTQIKMAVDGGASLVLGDDRVMQASGETCNLAFGGGCIGVLPGQVPPPPAANSLIYGVSGQTGVASTTWTVAL